MVWAKGMMRRFRISGQNLAEYAVCLTVVAMAVVGMQIYLQRSLQARYKQGVDFVFSKMRDAGAAPALEQYDPYYRQASINEETHRNVTMGFPYSSLDTTVNRTGWQNIGPAE
jgi:Flp pilus assembly pilin Flp